MPPAVVSKINSKYIYTITKGSGVSPLDRNLNTLFQPSICSNLSTAIARRTVELSIVKLHL